MSTTQTVGFPTEILNSWKEIAHYMGRGVRTVQRWEAALGLPVRRPHGRGRSAVLAMRCDLDEWLKSRPTRNGAENYPAKRDAVKQEQIANLMTTTTALLLEARRLRTEARQTRELLRGSVEEMRRTVAAIFMSRLPAHSDASPLINRESATSIREDTQNRLALSAFRAS